MRERPVYLREALLSRINPILYHTLSLLLLFAIRRSQPSSDFKRLLRFPIRQCSGLSCSTCACSRRNLQQTPLSSGFFITDGAGRHHSLVGGKKVASSVSLSFTMFLANLYASPRAHRSCFFNLLLRSILKFHSVGTAVMKNFDAKFSERRTFVFCDVCMTLRSSCESYSSDWSQDFCALP